MKEALTSACGGDEGIVQQKLSRRQALTLLGAAGSTVAAAGLLPVSEIDAASHERGAPAIITKATPNVELTWFMWTGSPAEVDALDAAPDGIDPAGVWAWIDESAGLVRERCFFEDGGIAEDEATGSAAMRLCALLGREIEIRQGKGSVIYAAPLDGGLAEIRGRVVADEAREHPIGG